MNAVYFCPGCGNPGLIIWYSWDPPNGGVFCRRKQVTFFNRKKCYRANGIPFKRVTRAQVKRDSQRTW